MKDICYKKNYITEAIARIDFINPIDELLESIPKDLSEKVGDRFPVVESRDITQSHINFSKGGSTTTEEKMKEWFFWNRERNRRISINKKWMILVQNRYSTFEDFEGEFAFAIKTLCEKYPSLTINRFGVRYINNIRLREPGPLDWEEYINADLISSIKIPKDKDKISRTFHNLEMNYTDFNVRFNFGIHNPDYPAIIKQKVFVLDIDAYNSSVQTKEDVIANIRIYHDKIQELFEYSITDAFRTKHLNNE